MRGCRVRKNGSSYPGGFQSGERQQAGGRACAYYYFGATTLQNIFGAAERFPGKRWITSTGSKAQKRSKKRCKRLKEGENLDHSLGFGNTIRSLNSTVHRTIGRFSRNLRGPFTIPSGPERNTGKFPGVGPGQSSKVSAAKGIPGGHNSWDLRPLTGFKPRGQTRPKFPRREHFGQRFPFISNLGAWPRRTPLGPSLIQRDTTPGPGPKISRGLISPGGNTREPRGTFGRAFQFPRGGKSTGRSHSRGKKGPFFNP